MKIWSSNHSRSDKAESFYTATFFSKDSTYTSSHSIIFNRVSALYPESWLKDPRLIRSACILQPYQCNGHELMTNEIDILDIPTTSIISLRSIKLWLPLIIYPRILPYIMWLSSASAISIIDLLVSHWWTENSDRLAVISVDQSVPTSYYYEQNTTVC